MTSALNGVTSFTPLPLYPLGNSPHYVLDRRLSGPQSPSGRYEEKNLFPVCSLVAIPTELSRLVPEYYKKCTRYHLMLKTITFSYIVANILRRKTVLRDMAIK
jgi:hypothetical protein